MPALELRNSRDNLVAAGCPCAMGKVKEDACLVLPAGCFNGGGGVGSDSPDPHRGQPAPSSSLSEQHPNPSMSLTALVEGEGS